MTISRLLAMADHIADTGLVYLVLPDGQVKPTRVDTYLAMTARDAGAGDAREGGAGFAQDPRD